MNIYKMKMFQAVEIVKASMDKKGEMSVKIYGLIAALVLIVLASSLAPTMFLNLNSTQLGGNAPSWLGTVLPIIVAAGLVFIVWRSFSK